jgi:ubiquinone/menaquinone biosynthesis C-methylase UbiE
MIPKWNKALAEISRLVAESGILLIVDFGLMENMHPFLKGILRLWLKIFYTKPCDDLVEGVKHLNQYGFKSDVSHPHKGYSIFIKSQKMKT